VQWGIRLLVFVQTLAFSHEHLAFGAAKSPRSRFAIPPECFAAIGNKINLTRRLVALTRGDGGIDADKSSAHTRFHHAIRV
jgi:hypothetical protein